MSAHENSVKEQRERAEAAEARVALLERQIAIMNHMLSERDALLRQAEFDRYATQIDAEQAGGDLAVVPPPDHEDPDEDAPDEVG